MPATLAARLPAQRRLQQLRASAGNYNGFNLIFSDGEQLAVFESVAGEGRLLGPGVYGLSNHLLDTPWPKVQHAKSALGAALARLPDEQPLLELLRDERQADDALLPRTGVSLEWERLLSSAFIRAPGYGTRCSSILHDGPARSACASASGAGMNPARAAGKVVSYTASRDAAACSGAESGARR